MKQPINIKYDLIKDNYNSIDDKKMKKNKLKIFKI